MNKTAARPRRATVREVVEQIEAALDLQWIPRIYEDEILSGRTRSYVLKAKSNKGPIEILYTLLGIELKIGRRRLMVPDWATARYLSVFVRIGLEAVAVPYDITHLSSLADELESSWQRMMMLAKFYTQNRSPRFTALVRSRLVARLREELRELGAGRPYPEFAASTKVYPPHKSSGMASK